MEGKESENIHRAALGRGFLYAHCQLISATVLTLCWLKGDASSKEHFKSVVTVLSVVEAGIWQISSQNIIFLFDYVNMFAVSLKIWNDVY